MQPTEIPLSSLRLDGGTQPRAELDQPTVDDYAERMSAGDKFPEVDVFFDGEHHWLANGFHRVAAAKQAGKKKIPAAVRQGARRDAVLFSVGANAEPWGLRRTRGDIERAVTTLLMDDEWRKLGTAWVAERAAVSERTVRNHEARLIAAGKLSELKKRTGKDGKSYPARKQPKPKPAAPPPRLRPGVMPCAVGTCMEPQAEGTVLCAEHLAAERERERVASADTSAEHVDEAAADRHAPAARPCCTPGCDSPQADGTMLCAEHGEGTDAETSGPARTGPSPFDIDTAVARLQDAVGKVADRWPSDHAPALAHELRNLARLYEGWKP